MQTTSQVNLSISTFSGARDNQATEHELSVLDFFETLGTPQEVEDNQNPDVDSLKESLPAWSPATFRDNLRANDNVLSASCLVFDLDTGSDGLKQGVEPEVFDELIKYLKSLGVSWCVHTSFTSGFFHPRKKLRVVIPFHAPVKTEEYVKLWDKHSLALTELGAKPDSTRRHPGGIFFAPAVLPQHKEFFTFMSETDKPLLSIKKLGVSLNSVRLGDDRYYDRVAKATEKHNALNAVSFALATERAGKSEAQVYDEIWPRLKEALEENERTGASGAPVKNWTAAQNAVRQAIREGLKKAEERQKDPLLNKPAVLDVSEKRAKRAENDLKKWLRVVSDEPARLLEAVTAVGQYVPHWLDEERVRAMFLTEINDVSTIDLGLAAGMAEPVGRVDDWMKNLETDDRGRVKPTDENTRKILRQHPSLEAVLKFNVRTRQSVISDVVPWNLGEHRRTYPQLLENSDGGAIAEWIVEVTGGTSVGSRKALENAIDISKLSVFDPFVEHLNNLRWDGTPRLATWLVDYAGAKDNEHNRAVGENWLTALVARNFEPGCKVDNMLVLIGPQGIGKSSLLKTLIPPGLFTDLLVEDDRDRAISLSKYALVEVAELSAFGRKDNEWVKNLLSGDASNVRAAYARLEESFPKRCVFAGTTNVSHGFLTDPTGARRYWIVEATKCLPTAVAAVRDQLLAEAVERYKKEKRWHLLPHEEALAHEVQEAHRESDIAADTIENYLNIRGVKRSERRLLSQKEPGSLNDAGDVLMYAYSDQFDEDSDLPKYITAGQVARMLGLDPNKSSNRVTNLLVRLGWEKRGKVRIDGEQIRVWVRNLQM